MKLIYCAMICIVMTAVGIEKATYEFSNEPIDVLIPCHKKDKRTLAMVVDGIKKHIKHRSIIVVSSEPLHGDTIWFDEKKFPFSKEAIAFEIFKDEKKVKEYFNYRRCRLGWIYQQLLKLYALFVIPDVSSNLLVIDADTVFLRPVTFQDASGAPLFNAGTEYNKPYFHFMERLMPGLKKVFPNRSGVSHHMLFQRCIMEDLFGIIQEIHHEEPWKAMIHCLDNPIKVEAGISEYELLFNFVFSRTDQATLRLLKWKNVPMEQFNRTKKGDYDYLSCHLRRFSKLI